MAMGISKTAVGGPQIAGEKIMGGGGGASLKLPTLTLLPPPPSIPPRKGGGRRWNRVCGDGRESQSLQRARPSPLRGGIEGGGGQRALSFRSSHATTSTPRRS